MTETPETTPAPRIRWTPRSVGSLVGHVGSLESWAFQLFKPGDPYFCEWALISQLPGLGRDDRYLGEGRFLGDSNHLDKLKVKAEKLLEQFAASLGAVFPDDRWQQLKDYLDANAKDAAGEADAWKGASALSARLRARAGTFAVVRQYMDEIEAQP